MKPRFPSFAASLLTPLIVFSGTSISPWPTGDLAFDWHKIKASQELEYHRCYTSYECARLEVLLDWSNLTNRNVITLAIAKLPATVDVTDESFGGTIIVNPGGPGGSGVIEILKTARSIQ